MALICETFPAYKLEDIENLEDLGPVLQAMNVLGVYKELTEAKRQGYKGGKLAGEVLQYDLEMQQKQA